MTKAVKKAPAERREEGREGSPRRRPPAPAKTPRAADAAAAGEPEAALGGPELHGERHQKSLAFYRDVLGFTLKERWEQDGALHGVEMVAGSVTFWLGQDDWKKGRDRVKGQGFRMYCGTSQDVDAIAAADQGGRRDAHRGADKTGPGAAGTSRLRRPRRLRDHDRQRRLAPSCRRGAVVSSRDRGTPVPRWFSVPHSETVVGVGVRRLARHPEVQEDDRIAWRWRCRWRPLLAASDSPEPPVTVAEIAGVWAGTLSHAGETEPMALELEPGADGKVLIRMSVPVAHLDRVPIGRVSPVFQGNEVRLGPFVLPYDRAAKTLSRRRAQGPGARSTRSR